MRIARQVTPGMPSIVFNGAALYSADEDRLLERSTLSPGLAQRVLEFARTRPLLPVVATPDGQYTRPPLTDTEAKVLADFRQLHVQEAPLPTEQLVRITLLSEHHTASLALHDEVDGVLLEPAYLTHFPAQRAAAVSRQRNPGRRRTTGMRRQGRGAARAVRTPRHPRVPRRCGG